MNMQIIEKTVLTAVMVAWYVWMPVVGYGGGGCDGVAAYGTIVPHFLYMWSHVNVWHLAGNVFVLWVFRGRLHVVSSVLMAFLCSWLPVLPGVWDALPAGEPAGTGAAVTVGFSGVLFAMGGEKWGIYCRRMPFRHLAYAEFCMKALPFALIGIFIPHINWSIHLYCLIAGFVLGRCKKRKIPDPK